MDNEMIPEPQPETSVSASGQKKYKPLPVAVTVLCVIGVIIGVFWAVISVMALVQFARPYDPHEQYFLMDWSGFNFALGLISGLLAIAHFSACGTLLIIKTRKNPIERGKKLAIIIAIPAVLLVSLLAATIGCSISHSSYSDPVYTYKGVSYSYYKKSFIENYILITGVAPGTDSSGVLEIPDMIDDVYVRYIDEAAFKNNTKITKVILPDSVQFIKKEAFSGCTSLKEVILPEQLHSINDEAFKNCISLEMINEPGIHTDLLNPERECTIYPSAFEGCPKIPSWVRSDKHKPRDNN